MVRPDYCAVDHLQTRVAATAVVQCFKQQLPEARQRPAAKLRNCLARRSSCGSSVPRSKAWASPSNTSRSPRCAFLASALILGEYCSDSKPMPIYWAGLAQPVEHNGRMTMVTQKQPSNQVHAMHLPAFILSGKLKSGKE